MVAGNDTSGLVLLGLPSRAELQAAWFVLLLAAYAVTLAGNVGVLLLVRSDPRLHTPMYFFLSHLSLLDTCYSSAITPPALLNLLLQEKVISFAGCAAQLFVFASCATAECYLLAAMAYDRRLAVWEPLLYSLATSHRLCVAMVLGACLAGLVSSAIHTVSIFRLPFCAPKRMDHFFCYGRPLLAQSCAATCLSEVTTAAVVGFNVLGTAVFILGSYLLVLSSVLRLRSVPARRKAFSTCAAHSVSAALYYSSSLFMYLQPSSSRSPPHDKVISVVYSVAAPMLNPLIYSLRNTDVKNSMRKAKGRVLSSLP
ncbi:O1020 protein, partial [Semnornis frantzii]|nr:O1020 protein [Semnornis frantzii]